jgi:apolipoprotein N-acyltransferase
MLIDAGADVLAVPAAWVRGPLKEDHWVTLLRARAIENTAYVIGAAQTGSHYCGRSMIIDPMGVIVASLGDEEAWLQGRPAPRGWRTSGGAILRSPIAGCTPRVIGCPAIRIHDSDWRR